MQHFINNKWHETKAHTHGHSDDKEDEENDGDEVEPVEEVDGAAEDIDEDEDGVGA